MLTYFRAQNFFVNEGKQPRNVKTKFLSLKNLWKLSLHLSLCIVFSDETLRCCPVTSFKWAKQLQLKGIKNGVIGDNIFDHDLK